MYLVIRLLHPKGFYNVDSHIVGGVELRRGAADSPSERAALEISQQLFGERDNIEMQARACTIVDAHNEHDAELLAEERFNTALDALDSNYVNEYSMLHQAGCFRSLLSGRVLERKPWSARPQQMMFHVRREGFFSPIDFSQILAVDRRSELADRLLRAHHWSRMASMETNRQIKILFRWFSMEAAWLLSRKDNIIPRVLWALGFPSRQGEALVNPALLAELRSDPRYKQGHRLIEKQLEGIKELRNNSVHNGFRVWDVPDSLLQKYDSLSRLSCLRVLQQVRTGLAAGLREPRELEQYLPVIFETSTNLVSDVRNNVLKHAL